MLKNKVSTHYNENKCNAESFANRYFLLSCSINTLLKLFVLPLPPFYSNMILIYAT